MEMVKIILTKIEDKILLLCLGFMGVVLFAQVFTRFILNQPLMWSEELVRFLQIWITFLGIGYGIRSKSHISMVLVYNKMNRYIQSVFDILTDVTIIVCFGMLVPSAWSFIQLQHQIASSAMGLKMSIVYFPIIVGSIVAVLYSLVNIVESIRKIIRKDEELSDVEQDMEGGIC